MSEQPKGQLPAVLLIDPKYPHNVGAALRTCLCWGVGQLWWTGSHVTLDAPRGERLPREERMKVYQHPRQGIPARGGEMQTIFDWRLHRPRHPCQGIPGARWRDANHFRLSATWPPASLPRHPRRAVEGCKPFSTGGYMAPQPNEERWNVALLIRQASPSAFLAFASNSQYMAGIGHRLAALQDSRLLPLVENSSLN
jgi:hypothetical protein